MTQILRDDQVGSEFFQRLRVDGVKAFASGNIFPYQTIDLQRRCILGNARLNDDALVASLRREIAFMADANNLLVEAQRKQNLRGRWQQRNDSHGQNVSHAIVRNGKKLECARGGETLHAAASVATCICRVESIYL